MVTQGISTEQYRRHAAAELSARLHADGGWDSIAEVIATADAIARYVEDGTMPAADDSGPDNAVGIEVSEA